MTMRVIPTDLPGVVIIEPRVFRDPRGFFLETYHSEKFGAIGIHDTFVQDNQSRSFANTVRGLHLQVHKPQAKLIRVVHGEILDIAADIRLGSPTFGQWVSVVLSAENFRQCFIPAGFAHGFCVLSEQADVEYKCSHVYDPDDELGIAWNDPSLGITWPVENPILSDRDRKNLTIAQLAGRLPAYEAVL
jgi:dTDP-4-dehydrorhamnose 3,5-epimerase